MNPKVLQEILGHSSITMTMDIYSHAMPDFKKSSMQKMDYLFKRNKEAIHPPLPSTRKKEKAKSKSMNIEL